MQHQADKTKIISMKYVCAFYGTQYELIQNTRLFKHHFFLLVRIMFIDNTIYNLSKKKKNKKRD